MGDDDKAGRVMAEQVPGKWYICGECKTSIMVPLLRWPTPGDVPDCPACGEDVLTHCGFIGIIPGAYQITSQTLEWVTGAFMWNAIVDMSAFNLDWWTAMNGLGIAEGKENGQR